MSETLATIRRAAAPAGEASRLPFIDLLRAAGSLIIMGHHLAYYGPLSDFALPAAASIILPLYDYGAMTVQVFLVLGGFVTMRSLNHLRWHSGDLGRFAVQRYLRLGLPYIATLLLAMAACALARPWLEERVVGSPPTWGQFLSHVFFLQFWLGHERLSAGVWYICIDFQLGLLFAAGFFLRDWLRGHLDAIVDSRWSLGVVGVIAWSLALTALFFVNRHPEWEDFGLYFFGSYFMGALVARELTAQRKPWWLLLYLVVVAAALAVEWRPRLAVCMASGSLLYLAGRLGWLERWPNSRAVGFLGRISYSLFLTHFSVLVLVYALWVGMGWTSPAAGIAGMLAVIVLSLPVAIAFYRYVEVPSLRLSRRLSSRAIIGPSATARPAELASRRSAEVRGAQHQVAG